MLTRLCIVLIVVLTCSSFTHAQTKPADVYPVLQKRLRDSETRVKELENELSQLKKLVKNLEAQVAQLQKQNAELTAEAAKEPAREDAGERATEKKQPSRADDGNVAPPAGDAVIVSQFVSIEKEQFGDRLTMKLSNVSGKPIKAIKGAVRFYDQFGDMIGFTGIAISIDAPIGVGESINEDGVWPLVDDRAIALMKNSPKDIKLKWFTEKVAYQE